MLLVFWNHNNFDNYLASRLYKISDELNDKEANFINSEKDKSSFIEPTKWCNVYEYLLDIFPDCLKCRCCNCKKSKKMESIEQARK